MAELRMVVPPMVEQRMAELKIQSHPGVLLSRRANRLGAIVHGESSSFMNSFDIPGKLQTDFTALQHRGKSGWPCSV